MLPSAVHRDDFGAVGVYWKAFLLREDGNLVAAALTRWLGVETTVPTIFQKSLKRTLVLLTRKSEEKSGFSMIFPRNRKVKFKVTYLNLFLKGKGK